MNENELKIVQVSLTLSGANNLDFTEKDLCERCDIQKEQLLSLLHGSSLKDMFSITKRSRVSCPTCKGSIEIDTSLNYAFCENCNGELDKDKIGLHSIGLNRDRVEEYIISFLGSLIEKEGWTIRDSDRNFLVMKKDNQMVAFSVSLNESGLKDFFALRGWSNDYSPLSFVIVSSKFDKFLSAHRDKDPKCLLFKIDKLFDNSYLSHLIEEINARSKISLIEKEAEKRIDIEFRKIRDLSSILTHWNDMLKMLPARALQKSSEGSPKTGNTFEKDIVSLFNFTILKSKYAAGRNQPDGIGMILKHSSQKSRWLPMEIKTFTPENEDKPFYPLEEAIRQIEKYVNSFKTEEILELLEVPAFIVIAYDFDFESQTVKTLIDSFETKHRIKLILFPLKSIIRMVSNYMNGNIFFLPHDIIERFLYNKNYISESDIDLLFKDLEKVNKEKYGDQMKIIRAKTKDQGR